MTPRPYEELKVWQLAHRLNLDVSALTRSFPRHERFELTSQLRRAVRSVPTNLVEGHGQYGPRNFLRHVRIAQGSLAEVDYLLMNARDEDYVSREEWQEFANRIWRIRGLLIALAKGLDKAA
jgi:four helix bundle protein